ncbi:MAG: hypothetical protein FD143_3258 [Ignavibacteria bacterium]|nr:MAG: hypothetical protein FD143_3258 [Ignavibacteria bacterium]
MSAHYVLGFTHVEIGLRKKCLVYPVRHAG